MAGIVFNVGPKAVATATGGGGQTLGAAQGTITINVTNVTQANAILQKSAAQMAQAMQQTAAAAVSSSRQQIAAAKAATAQAQSSAAQQIAANKALISNTAVTAAQQAASHRQAANAARLAAQQQLAAGRQAAQGQAAQAAAARQAVQAQIAQNRLLVSNISAANAAQAQAARQARAAAAAQAAAAQAALPAWRRFLDGLKDVRTELFGIGAGASLLTGIGLKFAGDMEVARIQLEAMTGSLAKGNALMERLRERGRQAGVPFQQMLTFATQLLPTLNRSTEELDRWFDIVRRTAVLNRGPTGGIQGAAFSLREAFLSVQAGGRDFVSLADRFNISKVALQRALDVSGGDFIKAMDAVLDQMGITTEMADRMADSFNNGLLLARDAALQLLGEGFGPLVAILGPMLQGAAEWMAQLRQTNPEVLALGAGLLVVVAAAAPLLLLMERLVQAWALLGVTARASILSMSRIGGVALGATAFAKPLGLGAGNLFRSTFGEIGTGNRQALTNEELNQRFRNAAFNLIVMFEKAVQEIGKAILGIEVALLMGGAIIQDAAAAVAQSLANITWGGVSRGLEGTAQTFRNAAFATRESAQGRIRSFENWSQGRWSGVAARGASMGIEGFGPGGADSAAAGEAAFNLKRRQAIIDFARSVEELERDSQLQRLQAHQQYERQVADSEAQYNLSRAREAEDFSRNRLRQEQQLFKDIDALVEEAARQAAEWEEDFAEARQRELDDFAERQQEQQEDHDEKIAEIREDSAKKINDIEKDYAEKREKDLQDHRDRIRKAAQSLDAIAIVEEQRRFSRERDEQEREHKERLGDERKSAEERIKEEQENFDKRKRREQEDFDERLEQELAAHQERLQEAKEADQRRIADMIENFAEAKRIEDEDRAIRLARQAADHATDLENMRKAHEDRMWEINRQEAERLGDLKEQHEDELEELGLYNAVREAQEEAFFQESLNRWKSFFDGWISAEEKARAEQELKRKQEELARRAGILGGSMERWRQQNMFPSPVGPGMYPYQHGGPVGRTGPAWLHAGEHVLSQRTVQNLRDMMHGGFSQSSLVRAVAGGGGGGGSLSVVFAPGSVVVNEAHRPGATAREVRDVLVELFQTRGVLRG